MNIEDVPKELRRVQSRIRTTLPMMEVIRPAVRDGKSHLQLAMQLLQYERREGELLAQIRAARPKKPATTAVVKSH
jgi:hypothetical protein